MINSSVQVLVQYDDNIVYTKAYYNVGSETERQDLMMIIQASHGEEAHACDYVNATDCVFDSHSKKWNI